MTFQAYLDTIQKKTGKSSDEFVAMARERGFLDPGTKTLQVVDWLRHDYNLGRGHAMALVNVFKSVTNPDRPRGDERIDKVFSGNKAHWRPAYDALLVELRELGPDITAQATDTYVSLLRGKKKFAIVQPTGNRLDIGIKARGAPATSRFEAAGTWNSMVTHRVRIIDPAQIDADVRAWLQDAYERSA
jgi:hypothetical protein